MLRQTVVKQFANNRNAVPPRIVGMDWMRPEARDPIEGDQLPLGHPNSAPYPFAADGHANPGGRQDPRGPAWRLQMSVKYVWEPYVLSVSGRISNPDGTVSTDVNDEMLFSMTSYELWDDNRDPVAGAAALLATNVQQPIAGVRSGIVGGREIFASNSGAGYPFPRQVLPDSRCAQKVYRYWALVMNWNLLDTRSGAATIVWEWRLTEV